MRIGSREHKELFCRTFLETHEKYEPEMLPWPELDDASLQLLRSIPVWSMAIQVEVDAGDMIDRFARTEGDPLVREALDLQAYEENRHGRMLGELIRRYGLDAEVVAPRLTPTRRAFIDFGYNECVDSFFAFGIIQIAREVKFLPEALVSLFTRVLWEEARHIVFFVNWIAYDRAVRGVPPPLQAVPAAMGYARAFSKTMGRAKEADAADKGVAAAGDVFKGLTIERFLQTCLNENESLMERFDPRLLRPRVVPTLVRIVMEVLLLWSRLRPAPRPSAPPA